VETSLRVIRVLEKPEMHEKGTSNMSTRTSTISTLLLKEDALLKLKMIGYWVTTIIVTLELLAGGVTDLIHGPALLFAGDPVVLVLAQLGYPVYLLTILGVWKLLGAVALLVPWFPRLKEWAYAGTFFVYVGAAASWAARGGGMGDLIVPLILAVLTLASWALRPPSRTLGILLPGRRTGVGPS
jgi:uncharacterized membrane protein YphA (DoxX/SURF4 family)